MKVVHYTPQKGQPGCAYEDGVSFECWAYGRDQQRILEWLFATCPLDHQFTEVKRWRREAGATRPYQQLCPVLHIRNRGVAALFKLAFGTSLSQQRQDRLASRRSSALRRKHQ